MVKILLNGVVLLYGIFSISFASAQSLNAQSVPANVPDFPVYNYHPPSENNVGQQRLLLQLSSTHLHISTQAQFGLDTSLVCCSRFLGLSRLSLINEGFENVFQKGNDDWFDQRDPAAAILKLPGLHGNNRLRLLVLLGAYYAFQPNEFHDYKDSVLFFLNTVIEECRNEGNSKWRRQALCLLGKVFMKGNSPEKGFAYFDQCIKECKTVSDREMEAKALTWQALYPSFSPGTTVDRINNLKTAGVLYHDFKNVYGEINVLSNIGYLWISAMEMKKGEEAFKQALHLEDSIGFPYTHYTTDNIAMVTIFEGKYGEPLTYALQTVKSSEKMKDSVLWYIFYGRLAQLYGYLESKWPESVSWAQKAFDRSIQNKITPISYWTFPILTQSKIREGKPAEALSQVQIVKANYPPTSTENQQFYQDALWRCYIALGKYGLAEKAALEQDSLDKKLQSQRGKFNNAFINSRIAWTYMFTGQYNRARSYLKNYFSVPSSGATLDNDLRVLLMLASIDSAAGNYLSSVKLLHKFNILSESRFNIQAQLQAEELAVKYETEKKENEIQVRGQRIQSLQQADQLRQTSLYQAELIRNITIGGIIVLLLIAGILIRQNRLKQKMSEILRQQSEIVNQQNAEITQKNKLLEEMLAEKNWLLKEVHHRVKNNLHTIICLLESQAVYLENDALKAIEKSQHRIYAMSLIHQKLYQTDDVKTIDMGVYIPELIQYLRDSFETFEIDFRLDIDPVRLSLSQAIPVGLIINEAVTNSIKYAFGETNQGIVSISFNRKEKNIELILWDNGTGMDIGVTKRELNSLGLELMKGLAKEIHADISFENEGGLKITVLIPDDFILNLDEQLNVEEQEGVMIQVL
jgi:two-component sensor histidine kinase/tetratricopeptide (TPR) repeat protein